MVCQNCIKESDRIRNMEISNAQRVFYANAVTGADFCLIAVMQPTSAAPLVVEAK